MPVTPSDFFKTERTASEIKSELLPRLFEEWAVAMLKQVNAIETPLRCIDLLAGLDLNEASPAAVQWLRQIYRSSGSRLDLNQGIGTCFYDADQSALMELLEKMLQLPFYNDLAHPPVMLLENNEELTAEQFLHTTQPTLAFIDPINEGFSQQFLLHAIQTETSDLQMLFDPKALENLIKKAKADSFWQQLFGERLVKVKAFYKQTRNAEKRETYLLGCFEEIFASKGFYTLAFRINYPDRKETNQYIVLATKSAQAYIGIKELLERYSDYQEDGVPLFGANLQQQQMALFHEHYTYSIANLVQELSQNAADFSNRTVQFVYEQHSIGTNYTLANYQAAYEKLMRQGIVRFINPKTGQPISKLTATSLVRYKK